MMLLGKLALRNLVRQKRRTALTMTAVIAAIGVLILGEGFIAGGEENIIVAVENGLVGHVLVRPPDYPTAGFQYPIDSLLTLDDNTRAMLENETSAWTERTMFLPLAIAHGDSLAVRAIGYDPERDAEVFSRDLWRVQGEMPAPDGNDILMTGVAAQLLDLDVGDRVVLQLRTHQGAINALDVGISGIVTTTNVAIDYGSIFVPQKLTARLIDSNLPSHVAIRVGHRDEAAAFRAQLAPFFGESANIVTWEDESYELLRIQKIRRKALNVIVFILMLLAAFGMMNTILMAAHERTREIGTLRAMGLSESGVLRLFLLEGAAMGVVGSFLGALWGGGLIYYWTQTPIDLTSMIARTYSNIQFSALLYCSFSLPFIAGAISFGVVIATLASIYPSRIAARLRPADAVRA